MKEAIAGRLKRKRRISVDVKRKVETFFREGMRSTKAKQRLKNLKNIRDQGLSAAE